MSAAAPLGAALAGVAKLAGAALETAPVSDAVAPLDETAESVPDTAASLAQTLAERTALVMLAQQSDVQVQQARLDRMRADFNAAQEERSEQLREMNALRDMAIEQSKKDDEILKKFIAMI